MTRTAASARRTLVRLLSAAVLLISAVLLLNRGYHHYLTKVYPMEHADLVNEAADECHIPPSLVFAVIHTESSFQEQALSPADAKGLMQLTDDTFLWALSRAGDKGKYTVEDLYDPAVNIHYGVYVLSLLGEQFDYPETVLAAYNAGQGRVNSWLQDPTLSADGKRLDSIPYPETDTYVERVLEAQKRYQTLYHIK